MIEIKKNYIGIYKISRVIPMGDGGPPKMMTMAIRVRVILERRAYGRRDVLIKPVSGSGTIWVMKSNVEDEFPDDEPKPKPEPEDTDDDS